MTAGSTLFVACMLISKSSLKSGAAMMHERGVTLFLCTQLLSTHISAAVVRGDTNTTKRFLG